MFDNYPDVAHHDTATHERYTHGERVHITERDVAMCGTCGRRWCETCHPTPSARCPFEYDHATGAWVVGHNSPGYLPEGDPYATAEWHDAWAILAGELDRYAEDDDNAYQEIECGHADEEDHDTECYGSTRALVDGIMADAEREGLVNEGEDFTVTVADNDDRLTTFFLVWSPDSEPDED